MAATPKPWRCQGYGRNACECYLLKFPLSAMFDKCIIQQELWNGKEISADRRDFREFKQFIIMEI
jgi:hypothetical protein